MGSWVGLEECGGDEWFEDEETAEVDAVSCRRIDEFIGVGMCMCM